MYRLEKDARLHSQLDRTYWLCLFCEIYKVWDFFYGMLDGETSLFVRIFFLGCFHSASLVSRALPRYCTFLLAVALALMAQLFPLGLFFLQGSSNSQNYAHHPHYLHSNSPAFPFPFEQPSQNHIVAIIGLWWPIQLKLPKSLT